MGNFTKQNETYETKTSLICDYDDIDVIRNRICGNMLILIHGNESIFTCHRFHKADARVSFNETETRSGKGLIV